MPWNEQWSDDWFRRLCVLATVGGVALTILLVVILVWPGRPPSCGSVIQILFVEIPDKHDECGRNLIHRIVLSFPLSFMVVVCLATRRIACRGY